MHSSSVLRRSSAVCGLLSAVCILAFASACSQIPALNSLEDTEWVLVASNGVPARAGANATVEFREGQVSGYAGCNWYGGTYSTQFGTLKVDELSSTARLCNEPEGVMEQEEAFLVALRDAPRYAVVGGWLHIESAAGDKFTFMERVLLAMDPNSLVGTRWELVSINEKRPLADSDITLEFQETSISGHAGCRDYRGEYSAEGDEIVIPALEMTTTECSKPEAYLMQEGEFTTYLSESRNYLVEGDLLGLTTMAGDVLRFKRIEGDAK